jgi:hypothetical protein
MGQLQQLVLQLVVTFLCVTAAFTWYSVAVVNGGYSPVNVPMADKVDLYYNQTYSFQSQLLNSSRAATQTPASADAATGLATLSAAGAQTVTLTLGSIGQMIDLVSVGKTTLMQYGIPEYFFNYATMFIAVLMGMIIFAAIYKWWI